MKQDGKRKNYETSVGTGSGGGSGGEQGIKVQVFGDEVSRERWDRDRESKII